MAELKLRAILVKFAGGSSRPARAEGNNAAWMRPCNDPLPLLGRCFPQRTHQKLCVQVAVVVTLCDQIQRTGSFPLTS